MDCTYQLHKMVKRQHTVRHHVLITAHPDDESMFFLPTLYGLSEEIRQRNQKYDESNQRGNDSDDKAVKREVLWLLCLTTGNYDGLGARRSKELQSFCEKVFTRTRPLNGAIDTLPRSKHKTDNQRNVSDKKNDRILDHWILLDQEQTMADHPTKESGIDTVAQSIHNTLWSEAAIVGGESTGNNSKSNQKEPYGKGDAHREWILYTFDENGVSGHLNHRDTFRAVQRLVQNQQQDQQQQQQQQQSPSSSIPNNKNSAEMLHISKAWMLESESNVLAKYIPLYSWCLLCLAWLRLLFLDNHDEAVLFAATTADTMCYRLHKPHLNWAAMATHESQFVWYRRLFVVFSSYTYVNVWRPIVAPTQEMKKQR